MKNQVSVLLLVVTLPFSLCCVIKVVQVENLEMKICQLIQGGGF